MKNYFLFIGLIVSSMTGIGQNHFCGTTPNKADTERIHFNLDHLIKEKSKESIYVPIQFIIVSNQFNDGAVEEQEVIEAMCNLNNYYDTIGIEFYLNDEFKYIISQEIYQQDESGSSGVGNRFNENKVENAVNVFIGGELATNNSGYYTSSSDVIYMDKRYINGRDLILAHELGHYFSLRHPFYGWERTIYNPLEPTPNSIFYRGDFREVEIVDRNGNCEVAADLLCDTAADYITDWDDGCDYTGGAVDPNGVLIDPDERNIMAYYNFENCEQYIFTPQQIELMLTDLNNRTNLIDLPLPEMDTLENAPQNIFPLDEGFVSDIDNAEFEWTSIEGVGYYIFELSFVPSFTTTVESVFTKETNVLFDNLFDGFTYYWRVSGISFTDPCSRKTSQVFSFQADKTSSVVDENLASIKLFPNPIVNNVLQFSGADISKILSIQLYDLSGQLRWEQKTSITDKIKIPELPHAFYILKVNSQKSYHSEKIALF